MQTRKGLGFIAATVLATGIAGSGYFIGNGISHRNDSSREISVKGLSEKEVPASIAIWTIAYSASGNDLPEITAKLNSSTKTVKEFFKTAGFAESDVAIQPPLIRDLSLDARDKDELPPTVRYVATQSALLRTTKVDLVKPAVAAVSQLIAAGVEISGRNDPDYSFNRLNEIKPEMIAEATKNARTAAEQFSRDAATQLGSLRSAQQGWFQVESRDIATPERKIVRVVVDVVFEIK